MIAIIDYHMGNLRSVQKAVEHVGDKAEIISEPDGLANADKVILPGVGAFADAIDRLKSVGMDKVILDVINEGRPFLGICLGYQLLFDKSYENGEYQGLGVFPGENVRFDFSNIDTPDKLKIPHMGWNRIDCRSECPLFNGIENMPYVYFVHSFHPTTVDDSIIAATTEYGYTFPSAVWKENVFATQFHPEKSQAVGLKILKNFVNL